MTLNEKIVDSVSKTTGIRCFEGMPPDGIVGRFAYFFPLRSGAAKRYNEVAIFFMERPVFTPLSPEKATNDCRYLALNWLNGLYAYSGLKFQDILSQNNTRDGFGGYGVGLRLVLVDEARHTGGAEPEPKLKYFTFTSLQDNSSVGWTGTYPNLEYSTDGSTWTAFTEAVSVNTGEKVMFRNNGTTWAVTSNSSHFTTTGSFDISGNIMSLVDPTLETTSLSMTYCFRSLFRECTGIVSAENLELADNTWGYCYAGMFYGCTNLETAPVLPATSMSSHCYNGMFTGCNSLTEAPELPATTLAQSCYASMFYGCTSLTEAPELPAETLAQSCYSSMFNGCSSLDSITVGLTSWGETGTTNDWVGGVSATGTFTCTDDLSIERGDSRIPTGWRVVKPTMYNVLAVSGDQTMGSVTGGGSYAVGDTVTLTATPVEGYEFTGWTDNGVTVSTDNPYTFTVSQAVLLQGNFEEDNKPLRFTALEDGSAVEWYNSAYPNLEYSKNGGAWTEYTEFTVADVSNLNTGDYVEFRNNGTAWEASEYQNNFKTTGTFNLSGNIMSLVDATMQSTTIPIASCFKNLFSSCGIVSAADLKLPATTLTRYCYGYMFNNCQSLTTSPRILPATTLSDYCYDSMFSVCASLTTSPELPATTLATQCYSSMFYYCASLTTSPELPATTLSDYCYNSMFCGTSLTTAPELPATTLATQCYGSMFQDCASLTTAPELPATTLAQSCYSGMFNGCTSLTTAPDLPAPTLLAYSYSYMFYGCTKLTYIKCLATNTGGNNCTQRWVRNVSASGTFVKDASKTWSAGESGYPTGWTVIDAQ